MKNIETKPVNQITLPTLRGPVESWIPQNFCEEIYNSGFESITANQTNIEEIKYKLDSSVVQLFDKVKINLTEPISNQLLKNQIQNLENLEKNFVPESDSERNETKIEDAQNNEPVEIDATDSAENPSDATSNKVEEKVAEAPETVKQS